MNLNPILEHRPIHTSVPCRVDFGGTLDISTFYLPMANIGPATVNLALDMRTHVHLSSWKPGRIKISSRGFDTIEYGKDEAGFGHAMGLMSAIVRYFDVHGLHLHIDSTSPPRSALGGSSSAAVAVIAAIYSALEKETDPTQIAWLAHYIESSVAGVVCGVQDQAAAAFGGANLWHWGFEGTGPSFARTPLFETPDDTSAFNGQMLVAYCGIPHVSKDVNKQWVKGFVNGQFVPSFEKIAQITKEFAQALKVKDFDLAGQLMNQETRIRCELTPQVLDKTGKKLFERAKDFNCGARFTGAGGGGCLWAVGSDANIEKLTPAWRQILAAVDGAMLLDTKIDTKGIVTHNPN